MMIQMVERVERERKPRTKMNNGGTLGKEKRAQGKGSKAGAKIHDVELGAKTCGTELGAKIRGAEVGATSRHRGCSAGVLPTSRRRISWRRDV